MNSPQNKNLNQITKQLRDLSNGSKSLRKSVIDRRLILGISKRNCDLKTSQKKLNSIMGSSSSVQAEYCLRNLKSAPKQKIIQSTS